MRFLNKILNVLKHPKIAVAYTRWNASKMFGNSPRIYFRSFGGKDFGASIGGWISFSDYWTYYNLIPANEEKLLLNTLMRSGKDAVAFDVGSNLGIFTCRIASLGYSVHSFEPIPDTYERFRKNVEFNSLGPFVHLNLNAVGAESGTVRFEMVENSPGQNRIAIAGGNGTIEIPVVCLDDYVEENAILSIDFLKIDVEGMETQVLVGASRLLSEKRIKTILIEICPWNLINAGSSTEELFGAIVRYGYVPRRLIANGEVGEVVTLEEAETFVVENVVLRPIL